MPPSSTHRLSSSSRLSYASVEKFAAPSRSSTNSSITSSIELQDLSPSTHSAPSAYPQTSTRTSTRSPPSSTPSSSPNFFNTLTSSMRGRSRNRSPETLPTPTPSNAQHRVYSPSPPPSHVSSSTSTSDSSQSPHTASPRPQQHTRQLSGSTLVGARTQNPRSANGAQQPVHGRENFHWQGRHSNAWLFNDFSVTDAIKSLARRGRRED